MSDNELVMANMYDKKIKALEAENKRLKNRIVVLMDMMHAVMSSAESLNT